jgi:hypothetical protein
VTSPYDSTALSPRLSIEELVKVYEYAERNIRDGFALIEQAEKSLNNAFVMSGSGWVRATDRRERVRFDDPDSALTEVRRAIWGHLVERLELRRVMSVKAWTELQRELDDGKEVPEITHETVTGMANGFRAQLPEMLNAAVQEVFEWLRPPGSEYKRNSEFEVPRRIVITWAVEQWSKCWGSWRMNYHREQNFAALERVFLALDGKGQVNPHSRCAIYEAVHVTPASSEKCEGETPYFRFRAFKNGNMHVTFLREDLLARFNQIAGGARLRGGNGRAA